MSSSVRLASWAMVGITASWLTATAAFAHFDVVPYSDGSKILTGGHDHASTPKITVESMNVYGYEFDDFPNDIGDPGINNSSSFTNGVFVNNGLLPAGMLSFSVYSGSYGSLHYWDGSGSPSFSPVTDGVEITLTSALGSLSIGGATTSGTLDLVDISGIGPAAGRVHDHLDSGISLSALAGIYAFGGVLSTAALGVAASDPIYLVYNVGASEEAHDAAIAFYESLGPTAVPEIDPNSLGSAFALVAGSLAWLERRRGNREAR
jgi:hypothetical protein